LRIEREGNEMTQGRTYPSVGDLLEYVAQGEIRRARVINVLGKWVQLEDGGVLAPGEWKFVRTDQQ